MSGPLLAADGLRAVHYLPVATTLLALPFCLVLLRHHRRRGGGLHLVWWAAGVACYGAGTALESAITLGGNSPGLTKAWYVAGALLGAYPLAQGTVFLLLRRRTAWRLTALTLPVALLLALGVLASPTNAQALEAHRPSGAVIGWTWLRACTPLLNLYAAGFLVGGAVLSALRYLRARPRTAWHADRALGNGLIALGALLPAIGGGMAKAGRVEALYVAELVGLVAIWAGYARCTRPAALGSTDA